MLSFIIITGISFLLTNLIIIINNLFDKRFIDNTDGVQKFHSVPTPRLGGISLFITLVFATLMLEEYQNLWTAIIISSLPAFIIGLFEDLIGNINPKYRLISTALSGSIFIIITGYSVNSIDIYFLDNLLSIFIISFVFSTFAIAGISNSINIIDGFNGLASGSMIIMMSTFAIISWIIGDSLTFNFSLFFIFSLMGFFIVNFPKGAIFLGDAGAYLSGFFLATVAIIFHDRNPDLSPWLIFLICSYPITETIFSMYRKHKRIGYYPSKPDSVHLHMLIYRDFSRRVAKIIKIKDYRNSITSVIMWIFPLLGSLMSILTFNKNHLNFLMVVLFVLFYLLIYRKVSLNWKKN